MISKIFYFTDKQDMGLMELEDLKRILVKYGENFDEEELELFEKSCPVSDGKVIVDGKFYV